MFGSGLPVELQNKVRLKPSSTVWLSLCKIFPGGTERKEYNNVWLWYRLIITTKKFSVMTLGSGKKQQDIDYVLYHSHFIKCSYHIF